MVENTNGKPLRDEVVPVIARYDQTVDIHWRLKDGRIVREKHTCPDASGEYQLPVGSADQ